MSGDRGSERSLNTVSQDGKLSHNSQGISKIYLVKSISNDTYSRKTIVISRQFVEVLNLFMGCQQN